MTMRRPITGVLAFVGIGLMAMAAAPTARAQVKLEYKFPEGQKFTYKTHATIDQLMTIMGQEIPTKIEQTVIVSRTAGQRASDGSLPVRQKIESFRMEMELPGNMQFTFDSKDPDAKVDNPQLQPVADAMNLVKEMDYTVVLDAKNKVKAVEGTEKLREKAEKLDASIREPIRARLTADKLKHEFEQSHGNVPDVLARPGEPWERTETMEGGGAELVLRKKYEYAGTEKKGDKTLDKITVKTIDFSLKPDPNPDVAGEVTKSDMKVESSDGTILFDREAGQVVETHETVRVKGTMTLTVGDQDIPGELELSIDTTNELQPSSK